MITDRCNCVNSSSLSLSLFGGGGGRGRVVLETASGEKKMRGKKAMK